MAREKIKHNRFKIAIALILVTTIGLFALQMLEAAGKLPRWLGSVPTLPQMLKDFWFWTRSWRAEKIAATLNQFQTESWATPAVLGGFVIGSFFFVPLTAMILGVALAFPFGQAVSLNLGGSMIAALATYGVGRYWAWTRSKWLSKTWVQKLSDQLKEGGVFAVTAVRMAPIAPFSAVGIVAGGLRVPFRDYALGTFFGLLPGVVMITFVSGNASRLASGQSWMALIWLFFAFSLAMFFLPRVAKRFKKKPA